jgi:adenylate kinase family enzyme
MDKEKIELIEDLPLRPIDIWCVFLVVLGKKPSSWFDISSGIWRRGQEPKHVCQSQIDDIKKVFDKIGVKYTFRIIISNAGIPQPDENFERLNEICEIFIAKDSSVLDSLIRAVDDKDHEKIGILLGFPKTAISAFTTKDNIKKSDLEPKIRFSEVASFTQFALSKNNWRQELQTVEDWLDTLKAISDITYSECRRQFRVLDDETREILINYNKEKASI